jgi:hypothetical protein
MSVSASSNPEPSIPIEVSVSAPIVEPRTPMASVATNEPDARPRPMARWPWVVALAVACLGTVLGLQAVRAPQASDVSAASGAASDPAAAAPVTTGEPVASDGKGVTYDALPAGFAVSPGQGLLVVKTSASSPVRVDGVDRGSAADASGVVRVPLTAGPHEVGVAALDRSMRTVEVRAGRAARVELSGP